MSTEHAVRSAGQKVYIEPGSAAYDPLQNFIQQSLNLGEIAETLSRNFLSEVIDRRDVDAKFPQLTEARFEGLKAKRRGVGVDPTYHLKDMPSRIVAEFLDDARRTGYYLTNFARSHDDPRDRYKATTVYDYVRGRQELEIPEKSPSNLRVAVTSWNTALQILQAALGTPEDQSEFDFSSNTARKQAIRSAAFRRLPAFVLTNPLREALRELTAESLPSLPQETASTALQRPLATCWLSARESSKLYFTGDTAKEYDTTLQQLEEQWQTRETMPPSDNGEILELTQRLHNTAYKWPDTLSETLAKVLDNFASDNYPESKQAALQAVNLAKGKSSTDYMGDYKHYVDYILAGFEVDTAFGELDALREQYFKIVESEKCGWAQSAVTEG